MTWMMFFLRMIFFADFLQESADDMGVEEGIDSLWVFASLLFFVQICRLFLGCVKLILVTQEQSHENDHINEEAKRDLFEKYLRNKTNAHLKTDDFYQLFEPP